MESDGTYSKVKMLSAEVLKPNKGIEENMRTSKVRYQQRTFPKKGLLKQTEWKVRRKKNTPAEVPVSQSSLNKHDTGADGINPEHVKTKFHQTKLASKKKKFTERIEQTARAELLNCEEAGFLEGDDNELTCTIRQQEIRDSVDIATASKSFDLCLDRFGPYRLDYTANGRHLLIGGKRGHIAAFDWMTKKLQCEISVLESIRDVQWLHLETMFAVAQKRWTYIYDANGVELHCLKNLHDVRRLEFLPHHFLLVAGTNTSFLHYLDVSLGKLVQSFPTHQGPLNIMTQNPENAIIHTGHSTGTVQLWSPNIRQPLVTLLAHRCGLTGITVEGNYMATAGLDCHLRIWDVRSYRQLYAYALPFGLSEVSFSQRYAVACAVGNSVQVFNDAHLGTATEPYLAHRCTGIIADLRFVPHEDILGVGHCNGFTSLIVPGCGEPNFDALHVNPFESKNQRREREVRQLLDKIQPELISLDTSEITRVNINALEEEHEKMKKLLYLNPRSISYQPKFKRRGRSGAMKREQRKQGMKAAMRFEMNEERKTAEDTLLKLQNVAREEGTKSVLDRFRRKDA